MAFIKNRKCPSCGKLSRSFWESEYNLDCGDCQERALEASQRKHILAALKTGKVKESDLTPAGRKLCGLPPQGSQGS
jgi:uncharacterized OB-fold protein